MKLQKSVDLMLKKQEDQCNIIEAHLTDTAQDLIQKIMQTHVKFDEIQRRLKDHDTKLVNINNMNAQIDQFTGHINQITKINKFI